MRGTGEASLRELLARLIESAKDYARAEVALVRSMVALWAGAARVAAVLVVVALFLLNAAVIVLLAALGMTIAIWLGPAAGLAIAGLLGVLLAGLLGWIAVSRFLAGIR